MRSDRERYMRWMEMMFERQVSSGREERRSAEVLEALRDLAEDSRRLEDPPEYEPERPRWWK